MKKQFQLTALVLLAVMNGHAQNVVESEEDSTAIAVDVADFTISESQLGEDDDMTSDIIQVGSSSNLYTSNIGWTWSAARFKFRALDNKYNDVYINGVQANQAESGRFQFSNIGGMNDAAKNKDAANPFESNSFSMAGLGGSTNYDFRASSMSSGTKVTLSGLNRNYTLRGVISHGTGLSKNGWAFYGTLAYRWGNMQTAAVDGTFYNSLSYLLSVQKKWDNGHSLNLATWGNPTERAQQGASTDEAYWLANDRQYNPYWGYQGGKKRASRIVTDFAPTALLTWDWQINDDMKLTTSAMMRYQLYSSTKLNYNGSNPAPDYWKNFPSSKYDVWGENPDAEEDNDLDAYNTAKEYWQSGPQARQINFDELYFANQQLNKSGNDAAYWIQARHNDHLATSLSSNFTWNVDKNSKLHTGIQLSNTNGMHYQTVKDMLGAENFHNVDNYLVGTYSDSDPRVDYDLNNPNRKVKEGDRFGYDYNIMVQKFNLYASYVLSESIHHTFIAGRVGGSRMWRDGNMRNGLFADNSYGKSGVASFLDGGVKVGSTFNLGHGHTISIGAGFEAKAPNARDAFICPEKMNDFVHNLDLEEITSTELTYSLNNSWLRLNLTGYYNYRKNGTEWSCYYDDNESSFTYVSSQNITKRNYGVELGAKIKVTSNFDITLLGTYSEAQIVGNTDVDYLLSNEGKLRRTICFADGIREGGTPLAATSIALNYRVNGWYLGLTGNYYDRIYLSYTPVTRMESTQKLWAAKGYYGASTDANDELVPVNIEQAQGNGGFVLDASIGKQFRLGKNSLSVNLNLSNITNNRSLCTGGYEQSRANYYMNQSASTEEDRMRFRNYNFMKNPKKYYAQGFNFMLNLNYRF